jgi:hypothetical protein
MIMNQADIAPARYSAVLGAAEAAGRAIPPAFPLDATVAVNPFLGQTEEDLATAAARLARVAGVRVTRKGADYAAAIAEATISDDDLAEALAACSSPLKPASVSALSEIAAGIGEGPAPRALPTVADLAADATGIDWPALIDRCIGLWAAGHFDRGQALCRPRRAPRPSPHGAPGRCMISPRRSPGSKGSAPMWPPAPTPPNARSSPLPMRWGSPTPLRRPPSTASR